MAGFSGLLDGPMFVVTATSGGRQAGCLVGFAAQCSLEPERYTVWLSKVNHTYRVARGAQHLGVHLLGRDQRALAELFGSLTGDAVDKFAGIAWQSGTGGTPLLDGVPARFVGRVLGRTDGGDHVGFLVEPSDTLVPAGQDGRERGEVLRLSDVLDLTPGHPAD